MVEKRLIVNTEGSQDPAQVLGINSYHLSKGGALSDWVIDFEFRSYVHRMGHFVDVLPISWLGAEETKPNTTKASNTWIKWSKLTQKYVNDKPK